MAINNINTALNSLNTKSTSTKSAKSEESSSSSSASGTKTAGKDTVKLTDQALSLSQLEQKISEASDTNTSKVDSIKAAIMDGSYQINSDSIAKKLMNSETALFGN